MIRRLLPPKIKLQLRLLQRRWNDRKTPFAASVGDVSASVRISVRQDIKRTSLFENKVHNLQTAAKRIESIVIHPGEVFSFWQIVGNPSEKNGYRTGRNILNGILQESVGGGLCQLSGIVYHVSLLAGLPVPERFNHTVDIYAEEDRFTPLGADATVVYGHKDLRVSNNLAKPLQFTFQFEEEAITCSIRCAIDLKPLDLTFERTEEPHKRFVQTRCANSGNLIATSEYRLPAGRQR
jgi:vancomycin resistance protein VanW